jgi:methyl-accepting chemotaxis protein
MSFTDRWQRTRKHLASFGVAPALFALALTLFLAASISLGLNLLRVRASFGWVKHTDEVLREAADLERDLLGAESAERGFLLTGDSSYRDSFERTAREVSATLDKLAELVVDNPAQFDRITDLRPIVEARRDEYRRVVELGPRHLDQALDILAKARAEQLTAQIEAKLGQFQGVERNLLTRRSRRVDIQAQVATWLSSGLALMAIAVTALGTFLLDRQRMRAVQAELLHRRAASADPILAIRDRD